jgi:hypothetical protein
MPVMLTKHRCTAFNSGKLNPLSTPAAMIIFFLTLRSFDEDQKYNNSNFFMSNVTFNS